MHFTDEFWCVYVSCWLHIFHPDISVHPQTTCCPYFSCENQNDWLEDRPSAVTLCCYCIKSATPSRHLCAQLFKPVISQLCMQSLCVCVCARARASARVRMYVHVCAKNSLYGYNLALSEHLIKKYFKNIILNERFFFNAFNFTPRFVIIDIISNYYLILILSSVLFVLFP